MKTQKPDSNKSTDSKEKSTKEVNSEKSATGKTKSTRPRKTSAKNTAKPTNTASSKSTATKKQAPKNKVADKSTKVASTDVNKIAAKKTSSTSKPVAKQAVKVVLKDKEKSEAPKTLAEFQATIGTMAPGTFSKAAFEEQVNLAIKESIARQKETNRVYNPEITSKMKSIIANYTESPELLDNLENNTDENFVEKLNIDSVDFVEIIVDAEEAFDIKMEDEEIKALRSFDDLYDLIEGKILENQKPKIIV